MRRRLPRLLPLLLPLLLLAGCGSALVGDAVPSPTRATVFGHQTDGVLVEGWLLVTGENVACDEITAVLDGGVEPGDSIWILLQKEESLAWEGLYPGTVSHNAGEGSPGHRHTEVYFRQGGDVAVLTGNDVWVEVLEYDGTLKAQLGSSLAEGLIVAEDCGAL